MWCLDNMVYCEDIDCLAYCGINHEGPYQKDIDCLAYCGINHEGPYQTIFRIKPV